MPSIPSRLHVLHEGGRGGPFHRCANDQRMCKINSSREKLPHNIPVLFGNVASFEVSCPIL